MWGSLLFYTYSGILVFPIGACVKFLCTAGHTCIKRLVIMLSTLISCILTDPWSDQTMHIWGVGCKNQMCINEERAEGGLSPHNSAYVSSHN